VAVFRGFPKMRHKSKSRVLGYQYKISNRNNLIEMEKFLNKAIETSIITQWDTDWTTIVWFNGWPCESMRKLKKQVKGLI